MILTATFVVGMAIIVGLLLLIVCALIEFSRQIAVLDDMEDKLRDEDNEDN